ncbi:hypothetical protein CPB86DRAFT_792246 [Serendipita vermifera]|nr:hypothetical protein CPB86DRAFT_792246 [Serendipita vermifera]
MTSQDFHRCHKPFKNFTNSSQNHHKPFTNFTKASQRLHKVFTSKFTRIFTDFQFTQNAK